MTAPTALNPIELLNQLDRKALDHEMAELSDRLKALGILRRACAARDGEEAPKKAGRPGKRRRLPGAPNGLDGSAVDQSAVYLRARGTTKPKLIAADLEISEAIVQTILETNADRFIAMPAGYGLRRKADV